MFKRGLSPNRFDPIFPQREHDCRSTKYKHNKTRHVELAEVLLEQWVTEGSTIHKSWTWTSNSCPFGSVLETCR